MTLFSLTSTRVELEEWADVPPENLPDTPEQILLTSSGEYMVLALSTSTGERSLIVATLASHSSQSPQALPSEQLDERIEFSRTSPDQRFCGNRFRPCLIPVRSFIAPRYGLDGTDSLFKFSRSSDDIVGLAGLLYEPAASESRRPSHYVVLSIDAPSLLNPVFRRLPAIVQTLSYENWLDEGSSHFPAHLGILQPMPAVSLKDWYALPIERDLPACANGVQAVRNS